jgi:hypothetical protein
LTAIQFAVGGYLIPRLEIDHSSPGCTIHAIHIHVNQTFFTTPPEKFEFSLHGHDGAENSKEEVRCPTEVLPVITDGKVPLKGNPQHSAPLWDSPQVQGGQDGEAMFVWQQDKLRLPDETKLRPTSLPGCALPSLRLLTLTLSSFTEHRLPCGWNMKSASRSSFQSKARRDRASG